MVEIGQRVRFIPTTRKGNYGDINKHVTGEIVGIHYRHLWFMVEYESGGNVLRECFKMGMVSSGKEEDESQAYSRHTCRRRSREKRGGAGGN